MAILSNNIVLNEIERLKLCRFNPRQHKSNHEIGIQVVEDYQQYEFFPSIPYELTLRFPQK